MIGFISLVRSGFCVWGCARRVRCGCVRICCRKSFCWAFAGMGCGSLSVSAISRVSGLRLYRSLGFIVSRDWERLSFSLIVSFM